MSVSSRSASGSSLSKIKRAVQSLLAAPAFSCGFLFIRPRRSEAPWLAYGESRACTPQCFLLRSLVVSRSPTQVNERPVYKRRPLDILPRHAPAKHIAHDDRHLAGNLNTRSVLTVGLDCCCIFFRLCAHPGWRRDVTSTTVVLSGVPTTRVSCGGEEKGAEVGIR